MTVQQLIERLQSQNPDAPVLVQQDGPYPYMHVHTVKRKKLRDADADDDESTIDAVVIEYV